MQFAEQIAVLDGLGDVRPGYEDGRTGANRAAIDQYAKATMPGVLKRRRAIDTSEGANYSGGSSYAPGLPLLPSTIGLADMPGVLPTRRKVLDPSAGANYGGGSSYAPGLPLLPSSVGLAAATVGSSAGTYSDQDLAGAFNALSANLVTQYAKPVMPGVLQRGKVVDPSEGANYGGGSSYAPGLPLLPSTVGLSGLDNLSDLSLRLPPKMRVTIGQGPLRRARVAVLQRAARLRKAPQEKKPQEAAKLNQAVADLRKIRAARAKVAQTTVRSGVSVSTIAPYSPALNGMVTKGGVPVYASGMYSPALSGGVRMRGGVPVYPSTGYSPTTMWK